MILMNISAELTTMELFNLALSGTLKISTDFIEIIKHKNVDERTILIALDKAEFFGGDSNNYRDIANAAINSPKCTTNALIKIINFTKLKSTIVDAHSGCNKFKNVR